MTTTTLTSQERLSSVIERALPFLALAVYAIVFFGNIDNSLSARPYGSREAQTAISVLWLDLARPWAYETPIIGAPWQMPMEFPVFHMFVRVLYDLTGNMEASGFLVSVAFFFISLFFLGKILRLLGANARTVTIFHTLSLFSPLYLYWTNTFMIETVSIAFAAIFAWGLLRLVLERDQGMATLVLLAVTTLLSGCLGILAKATTFLPVLLILGLFCLYLTTRALWTWRNGGSATFFRLMLVGAMTLVILAAAMMWVGYADAVKAASDYAFFLTSTSLKGWNWGSLELRFRSDFYETVFLRMIPQILGYAAPVTLIAWIAVMIRKDMPGTLKWLSGALVLAFAFGPLLFANLHIRHTYYQTETGLFLIAAMAVALAQIDKAALRATVIVVSCLGSLAYFIGGPSYPAWRSYGKVIFQPVESALSNAGDWLRNNTDPDDKILVFGISYNAELHYYARRRGVALPGAVTRRPETMAKALDIARNDYAWVVDCSVDKSPEGPLRETIDTVLAQTTEVTSFGRCDIYKIPENNS